MGAGIGREIATRPAMPTGPLNCVADDTLARQTLGWEPRVPCEEGLQRTATR